MNRIKFLASIAFLFLLTINCSMAQELYSARGYWVELNKETYKKLKERQEKGEVLAENESLYFADYEVYLNTYYQRMSDAEKVRYDQMKNQWDAAARAPVVNTEEDFELRPRDRVANGFYGFYYGLTIVAIGEIDNAGPAIGIPLIMAGLWQLGPVINKKKYDNISLATIRAGNTGRLLGLGYGAALGLAIGGDSENTGKLALGLSSAASIAWGEIAFQRQKKNPVSEGHIELTRHYGFLGPLVALSGIAATNTDNANLIGVSLLAGGVGGLLIGKGQANKYDYSSGDVNAISSLSLIAAGLGFAVISEMSFDSDPNALLLIPAATAIAGTVLGQRSVRGVHLTKRQGSTISLSSGGAALVGLGVVAITESESPAVWFGVPSALALVAHQLVFHSYKNKNLISNINRGATGRRAVSLSIKATPENYLVNKNLNPDQIIFKNDFPELARPIVNLKLKF